MPDITRMMLQRDNPDGFTTLFDVCLDLHMGNNGSGDPWVFNRERSVHILKMALAHWREGPEFSKDFDDAVKNLVEVTLAEDARYNPGDRKEATPQCNYHPPCHPKT